MRKSLYLIAVATVVYGMTCGGAAAQDKDLAQTVQELQSLLNQQAQEIQELRSRLDQAPTREQVKQLVTESAQNASMPSLPKWLEGVKLSGDFRLRYQRDFDEDSKTRNRVRYRLRVGLSKTWLDGQFLTAFRLASGDTSGATSTNETMGDYFASDDLWIDLAYAAYKPKAVPGLMIVGGKMKNPFVATDMIWDGDVTPEGGFVGYSMDCDFVTPFAGAGYFIIDENSTEHDVSLAGYQVGATFDLGPVQWKTSGAYYYFEDYENSFPAAGGNNEAGGPLLAGNFHVLDILNTVKFDVVEIPVSVTFDWARNLDEDDPTPGWNSLDTAWAAYLKVGRNKSRGDWSLKYKYGRIEANATPGGLNDADFGGTNTKGHSFGGAYNLTDFLVMAATVTNIEEIDGSDRGEDLWRAQLDLNFKY